LLHELFRQLHLEFLQLFLCEKRSLISTLAGTSDDQRITGQAFNPDAFRTAYEQP